MTAEERSPLPEGLETHPRFVTDPDALMGWCRERLPWRQEHARLFGRCSPLPRLTAFAAPAGVRYRYSGVEHTGSGLPPLLAALCERAGRVAGVPFDSVLASFYRSGADRVGWHADDERALGPHPVVAIASLGAPRPLAFRPRPGGEGGHGTRQRILVPLEPGSLLVMAAGTQSRWQHALPPRVGAGARISLGFRCLGEGAGA